jgi:ribosome maturation protein SDO1
LKRCAFQPSFAFATLTGEILQKGELQVNNLERAHNLHAISREIATLISEMTVDPTSTPPRKHTVGMIEKAMSEVGYSVKPDKSAKAQALELIKRLSEGDILPMRRVRMRVRVTMPAKDGKRIGDKVRAEGEVEEEETGEEWEVVSSSCLRRGLMIDHAG